MEKKKIIGELLEIFKLGEQVGYVKGRIEATEEFKTFFEESRRVKEFAKKKLDEVTQNGKKTE